MANDAKDAWAEVGERFSSWGRHVAVRYHEAGGGSAKASGVADQVIDEVSRGVSALTHTLRDDDANRDLGGALSAVGDAVTATVEEIATSLRSGGRAEGGPHP